jgi:hypothetical protein
MRGKFMGRYTDFDKWLVERAKSYPKPQANFLGDITNFASGIANDVSTSYKAIAGQPQATVTTQTPQGTFSYTGPAGGANPAAGNLPYSNSSLIPAGLFSAPGSSILIIGAVLLLGLAFIFSVRR